MPARGHSYVGTASSSICARHSICHRTNVLANCYIRCRTGQTSALPIGGQRQTNMTSAHTNQNQSRPNTEYLFDNVGERAEARLRDLSTLYDELMIHHPRERGIEEGWSCLDPLAVADALDWHAQRPEHGLPHGFQFFFLENGTNTSASRWRSFTDSRPYSP